MVINGLSMENVFVGKTVPQTTHVEMVTIPAMYADLGDGLWFIYPRKSNQINPKIVTWLILGQWMWMNLSKHPSYVIYWDQSIKVGLNKPGES